MFKSPPVRLGPGQALFDEGGAADAAYLIETGEVQVVRGDVVIATLGPGELAGEMSLVGEGRRSATARALDGGAIVQPFTRDELEKVVLSRPDEGLRLIRALVECLRSLHARAPHMEGASALRGAAPSGDGVATSAATPAPGRGPRAEVVLHASGPRVRDAMQVESVRLASLPFRIGRSKGPGTLDLKELRLPDDEPFQVSRDHCSLEQKGGEVLVLDRGSAMGTLVNGERIGGRRRPGAATLRTGDNELVIGRHSSPWRFRVEVSTE